MKILGLLLLTASFLACGVPQEAVDSLRAENQALQAELSGLKGQVQELEARRSADPVTLDGTATHRLESAINGQRYLIKVKLPRGYESEDRDYPVLYVTDAETNFGGVTYIVQRLIKDELIPKILVVGVAYDTTYDGFYRLRSRDLTPTRDPNNRFGHKGVPDPTGGAPLFQRFLAEELFPFVESTYRADPDDRALYGHSYGGLFGSWVLVEHPELFRRYLLLSPSLWFHHRRLLNGIDSADLHLTGKRIYMASGRLEGLIDDHQVEFVDALRRQNPESLDLRSEVLDNETHRTVFGRGFTNGLRFLYEDWR